MTDEQFMVYLFMLLWNDLTDGDTPDDSDFDTIKEEFENRDIDYDELTAF